MAQINVLRGDGGALKAVPLSQWRPASVAGDSLIELYERVPWLGAAVRRRASALSRLPRAWVVDGDEVERLSGVLAVQLGPVEASLSRLLYLMEHHLVLYGRAYLYKERNRYRVIRLRQPHPTTVTPEYNLPMTQVVAWQRTGGESARWLPDEVVAVWEPNPRSEIDPGTAPAVMAVDAAGALRAGSEMVRAAYNNGVFAPTLLIDKSGVASSDELEKLEAWFRRAASGWRNVARALGLRSDVEVKTLPMVDLDKLAVETLTTRSREDIATALGIPQTLLFSNAANYATASQDALSFYSDTVVPQAERIAEALNEQLFSAYKVELKFKPDRLEVFQAQEAQKSTAVVSLFAAGVVTLNEVRSTLGYEPVAGGDTLVEAPQPEPEPAPQDEPPDEAETFPAKSAACHVIGDDERNETFAQLTRYAIKRWEEGKPDKLADFESDYLSESAREALIAGVKAARDKAGVKAAVEFARLWGDYP